MIRPSCSYFYKIENVTENDLMTFLQSTSLNDYLEVERTGYASFFISLVDGATEQDDDFENLAAALSKQFPTSLITFNENNEELYSPDRELTYLSGNVLSTRYGRKLAPGEYDQETLDRCKKTICDALDNLCNPRESELLLPDGNKLYVEITSDSDYPGITIDLIRADNPSPETVCFVEYNPEKNVNKRLCIGVYDSKEEDTVYYESYEKE